MHPILTPFLNNSLSSLTVLAQLISIFLLIVLFFSNSENQVFKFIKRHGMMVAFIVAGTAMAGSLAYSDLLGYEPCRLCWYQRILMYPQVLILGIGLAKQDRSAMLYSMILSLIGIPLAFYHYLGQIGQVDLGCQALGYSVSCSKFFSMNFGYITIPLMSFSAFLLIALLLLISHSKSVIKSEIKPDKTRESA